MIAGTSEIHLRQITNLLRRRWKLIGAFALIGGAIAGATGYLLPARYTAKSQLLYEAEVRNGVEAVDEAAIDTLVELLVSPSHLRRLEASLAETPIVLPARLPVRPSRHPRTDPRRPRRRRSISRR